MKYYLEVLKKYAEFSGRARRKEYWMFILFNAIFTYSLLALDLFLKIGFLNIIYTFAILIPSIAVGVRRMHDVGKSGWFILIPFYNLVLACTNGEQGRNQYGTDPKGFGEEINDIGISQE